ncbi:formate dehydrogenase subunit delta [Marinivivus vitaminiproducens]|uniref:formate dehydrogenase subunit delta n=1 Tax=Marinivivus vitaminiproducens TaxID=3035935 RepID=UPI0027AA321F|nr:formate dehydrogenase subunit delta [Geminicoccaceae bacterium SCSIO 64248]
MKNEKLVMMANQIAAFFRSYPEEQAAAGVKDHIVAFWTPKMRCMIVAYGDGGGEGLDPLVLKALTTFPRAESPIRKERSGPGEEGELASDAG